MWLQDAVDDVSFVLFYRNISAYSKPLFLFILNL